MLQCSANDAVCGFFVQIVLYGRYSPLSTQELHDVVQRVNAEGRHTRFLHVLNYVERTLGYLRK